ncbi:AAA family ATPase [Nodosilinea sp. LEGE 07088]|uniref:AAA family ATPase n=1 Tax=Nodosilinea sp. LEGE 07088 TaxID=2777968 RepID=UPI001882CF3E|nr:AAA family ATPase [Nodosilinea sp. LEGE 07088]MBE9137573.1 AAA family ATPase [Nodosilinea sp. LEGE 07088]
MKKILLTGMSGTGKSSVIEELRRQGFRAIDLDEPGWSEHDNDGNQQWCESRVQEALDSAGDDTLFLSGCAENQVKFYPQLTDIILLRAPAEILIDRLSTRTNNPYGKRSEELEEVLYYLETVEPLLRRGATCEIETTISLNQVVEKVLACVRPTSPLHRNEYTRTNTNEYS